MCANDTQTKLIKENVVYINDTLARSCFQLFISTLSLSREKALLVLLLCKKEKKRKVYIV